MGKIYRGNISYSGEGGESLPVATDTTLGGVKIASLGVSNIVNDNGNISINTATAARYGVMKAGNGLYGENGIVTVLPMTDSSIGGAKKGNGLRMDNSVLSVKISHPRSYDFSTSSSCNIASQDREYIWIQSKSEVSEELIRAYNEYRIVIISVELNGFNAIIPIPYGMFVENGCLKIGCKIYNISDSTINIPSNSIATANLQIFE